MNLSEPLEGLMSPVEAAVLRVLSRTDAGLSGRQAHALAGEGSITTVHRALRNLAHVGLAVVEVRPPSLIYRPNREHVLWSAVDSALRARERAIDGIRQFFVDNVPEEVPLDWHVTATLYGSVARRTSTADSDVDVLVVFPDDFDSDARADFVLRLAERIEELTGNDAQVNSLLRGEFLLRQGEDDPFLSNVTNEGIHLFGPTPDMWRAV
ncbi:MULTISPECIES: nucleotidyltransferase family protein [Microbacterium]|uniref:nucleotidyltransferase family protein n=1 Tax=Microbacterium TaxID=33882 RepID=UPI00278191CE|nr:MULTISPECIES: nucleotidyltransferase domain-containing protein [Microbacterium]MDQ1075094.1 putative nucleotidyltransferase [Microbacterium sp. SORGH_AS_0969]MDQ1115325.1 putative nucleotidyltransferase [Microbacterium testaceum]